MLIMDDVGQGPPLVMLHAVGTSGKMWWQHIPRLANRFRVLAPDLPGHGRSPKPQGTLSIEKMSEELYETLRALNLPPVHCLGLSLGGMVAQMLAVEHPPLVASLTLCDTICEVGPALARILEDRAISIEEHGLSAHVHSTLKRWFSPDFFDNHHEVVKEIEDMLLATDPVVIAETWRAIAKLNLSSRLSELNIRSVVINGERDTSLPPDSGKRLATLLPAPLFELPGCAHMAPLEAPNAFMDLVEDFLLNEGSKIKERR